MEKKSQRQPGKVPQSNDPANVVKRCEEKLRTIANSLIENKERKLLTAVPLIKFIDELDKMQKEIHNLIIDLPEDDSRKFIPLWKEINAAIAKLYRADIALNRNNDHLRHVTEAMTNIYRSIGKCKTLYQSLCPKRR